MSTVAELAARFKNPYREEDYFSLNVRNGVIRSPVGTRLLAIPGELVQGLHAGLEEECGAAAPVVLYACGKWWGKRFVQHQSVETRAFFTADLGDLPAAYFVQVLQRVWAMYGWGKLEIGFGLREHGFVEAQIDHAVYSDVVGTLGRTGDHLIAGVLASAIGSLAGRELECVETACRSRGDQRCTFVVGTKARVDTVAAWVKQKTPHARIAEAIRRGEAA